MPKRYKITSSCWLIRDEASVKFHIESGDYFGTMATVLNLLKQQIKKDGGPSDAILQKTLKNLETDLLFLQKNYQINLKSPATQSKPKTKNKNIIPKGRLINQ